MIKEFPKADFRANYRFFTPEEGGRTHSLPYQGYRSDFMYEEDEFKDGMHMIWPRFLSADGAELPQETQVRASGEADFYIVNNKLRVEIHQQRLKVGTRFFIMEGPHRVGCGTVTRLLALNENAKKFPG